MKTKIYTTTISVAVNYEGKEPPKIDDIINSAKHSINLDMEYENGENCPTDNSLINAVEIDWENLAAKVKRIKYHDLTVEKREYKCKCGHIQTTY